MPKLPYLTAGLLAVTLGATPVGADQAAAADPSTFTVCLQPLGKHDKKLLAPIARGVEELYGFTVRTLDKRALPEAAWYAPRKRYRADRLLDHLAAEVVPDSGCNAVIGVTSVDISVSNGPDTSKTLADGSHPEIDWGIFGLAYVDSTVAVVSSHRLTRKASKRKLVQRVVKVANHELGHVLGLEHTDGDLDRACIMNDAGGTIRTVDAERGTLCAAEQTHIEDKLGVTLAAPSSLDWRWIEKGKR